MMARQASRLSRSKRRRAGALALAFGVLAVLPGCASRVRHHGYVISQNALSQVPVGSSQEQVLLVLGTPSTSSTVGGETFYYISYKIEERAFFAPEVTDRRVLAIHFDQDRQVQRIAEYGLEDGRVVDLVTRTTPSGGQQVNFIRQLLGNVGQGTAPF